MTEVRAGEIGVGEEADSGRDRRSAASATLRTFSSTSRGVIAICTQRWARATRGTLWALTAGWKWPSSPSNAVATLRDREELCRSRHVN